MDSTINNSTTKGVTNTPDIGPRKKLDKRGVALSRLKRRLLKHVWLVRIGLILAILLLLYLVFSLGGKLVEKIGFYNYSELVSDFLFTPSSKVSSIDSRTNLVILGKAGEGFDGAELTDTIIFSSISHSDPSVTLVSLPRDIWVPEIRAKLNSAYYWGNQKQEDGGLVLAKSLVEQVVGKPVQYGVMVDFSGFTRIIDVLGGVEVEVEMGFVDEKYPIVGRENDECEGEPEFKCRYETLRFAQGKQLMDGATALKFVRSRNAEGDEGTDLAREARQQKVIAAIKDKVLSPKTLLNFRKTISIWNVLKDSVETDMDSSAVVILARRVLQSGEKSNSYVLPEEFLENPPISPRYDNQYVFIPSQGDWSEVQNWIESKLR